MKTYPSYKTSFLLAVVNLIMGMICAYSAGETDDAGSAAVLNFLALANLVMFFLNATFAFIARHRVQ